MSSTKTRSLLEIAELGPALRSLRRAPSFTIPAALTLALGIGATVAVFSIVNAVLLRPLPYFQADRLVRIRHALPGLDGAQVDQSLGSYFQYRRGSRLFASIAGYSTDSVDVTNTKGAGDPQYVSAARISANLLPTLHVSPVIGRGITQAEDRPNGEKVVLIGSALWRSRFAADPRILGTTLRLDGVPYEVVGVLPSSFHFPERSTELWLPLALDSATPNTGVFTELVAIGRLRPGATLNAAQVELQGLLARLPESYPAVYPGLPTASFLAQSRAHVVLRTMRDYAVGEFARILWVIAATAMLVLVVTCANIANLILVRTQGRERELAVRVALGASRTRLFARFLTDGLVLAMLGGAGGVALAVIATHVLVRLGPSDFPRLEEIGTGGLPLALAAFIVLGVAVLCSLLPMMHRRDTRLGAILREVGRSGTAGRERHHVQFTLVAAQVALAFVLLAASGLLVRTVFHLRNVDLGFDPTNTLTLSLSLPITDFPHPTDVSAFYDRLAERVHALPGVEDAGVVSKLPLEGHAGFGPVYVEQLPVSSNILPPLAAIDVASAGYFRAMRIPVITGRLFGSPSQEETMHEVLVSRAFAEHYWRDPTGRQAIGQRLRVGSAGPWSTIVGIVGSVRDTSPAAPPQSAVYFPLLVPIPALPDSLAPRSPRVMTFVVRTTNDPAVLTHAIRREIRALDPSLPAFNVHLMKRVVASAYARTTFVLSSLMVAAAITLLLCATGLYGIITYIVTLRTRELGLRIALGAQPASVQWLVLRQGLGITLAGITVGLAIFAAVGRVLRAMLFDVNPDDPLTLLAVCGILLLTAALAVWLPVRHAVSIDPLEALRAE